MISRWNQNRIEYFRIRYCENRLCVLLSSMVGFFCVSVTIISFNSALTYFSKSSCGCFPASFSIIAFFESFIVFSSPLTSSRNWLLTGKVLFQIVTLFFSLAIFSNKPITFFSCSSVVLDSSGTFLLS